MNLPQVYNTQWIVFLFKILLNGSLHDFKGFLLVIISISFCDLGIELYSQDLVKFLWCHWFEDIFEWWDPTSFLRRSFSHCFMELGIFWLCLFTAAELSSCIASFETTGNLRRSTFLRWLWICCCVVIAGLGITWTLSKYLSKLDIESWKLPLN